MLPRTLLGNQQDNCHVECNIHSDEWKKRIKKKEKEASGTDRDTDTDLDMDTDMDTVTDTDMDTETDTDSDMNLANFCLVSTWHSSPRSAVRINHVLSWRKSQGRYELVAHFSNENDDMQIHSAIRTAFWTMC